ncbi:hypothetical protein GMOD_00000638 [Pyrenophora seminiperda CCB06]|uniref:Uncharacterized protein n=1 Tax=Pyrenophora seminiperda CCB06 TaxID=1302712 RepID=A0A3M7M7R1_9PLEO|nr:hypothetical protein GMOD_00000638 [Pyrenophora seminiperda CCB06]
MIWSGNDLTAGQAWLDTVQSIRTVCQWLLQDHDTSEAATTASQLERFLADTDRHLVSFTEMAYDIKRPRPIMAMALKGGNGIKADAGVHD